MLLKTFFYVTGQAKTKGSVGSSSLGGNTSAGFSHEKLKSNVESNQEPPIEQSAAAESKDPPPTSTPYQVLMEKWSKISEFIKNRFF